MWLTDVTCRWSYLFFIIFSVVDDQTAYEKSPTMFNYNYKIYMCVCEFIVNIAIFFFKFIYAFDKTSIHIFRYKIIIFHNFLRYEQKVCWYVVVESLSHDICFSFIPCIKNVFVFSHLFLNNWNANFCFHILYKKKKKKKKQIKIVIINIIFMKNFD